MRFDDALNVVPLDQVVRLARYLGACPLRFTRESDANYRYRVRFAILVVRRLSSTSSTATRSRRT